MPSSRRSIGIEILFYFVNSVNPEFYPIYLLYVHSLAVKNCITEDALCTF